LVGFIEWSFVVDFLKMNFKLSFTAFVIRKAMSMWELKEHRPSQTEKINRDTAGAR
jgi:hypothetical protein